MLGSQLRTNASERAGVRRRMKKLIGKDKMANGFTISEGVTSNALSHCQNGKSSIVHPSSKLVFRTICPSFSLSFEMPSEVSFQDRIAED